MNARRMLIGMLLAVLVMPAVHAEQNVQAERQLRVCSDPNNLPFSNEKREGFENRIAELIARELRASVRYTWWAQRRGFFRNTLNAGQCDVVMGVPGDFELVLPTRPYYRSTYVFVTRKDRGLAIRSFDDPVLRRLRIGVHIIGDDYASTPPAHSLAKRHIIDNVVGYSIYGDYSQANPPARIIVAVARGEIDVAIVWGPFAGYFAGSQPAELEIVPVSPAFDLALLPMVYEIGLGVRRGDRTLKTELEQVLERKKEEIRAILEEYRVPLMEGGLQAAF